MMESNYADERAKVSEAESEPRSLDSREVFAHRLEVHSNALNAISMLLKMADEERLDRYRNVSHFGSLYEPLGNLMEILSDDLFTVSEEAKTMR